MNYVTNGHIYNIFIPHLQKFDLVSFFFSFVLFLEELETNSKIKNIRDLYRGISDFKKGYQPRTNVVKDEKDALVADSYSIVAKRRSYFSQLLKVHGVNDIKHTDIQTAEPLVLELSAFEFELAIENLKSHK